MLNEDPRSDDGAAEQLLRRALLDQTSSVAVSLRVGGLPLSDAVPRDLPRSSARPRHTPDVRRCGSRGSWCQGRGERAAAGCPPISISPMPRTATRPSACVRAGDCVQGRAGGRRHRARGVAGAARANFPAASASSMRSTCPCDCPRRVCSTARGSRSPARGAPVCSARTLAQGRPPMGIACAQQDVTRVYALADDPVRCVEDFSRSRPITPTHTPSASSTRRRPSSASSS